VKINCRISLLILKTEKLQEVEMRQQKALLLPLAILGLVFGVQIAIGQVITSTIYGVVTDPSGATIPGATITATSEDSGATASVVTNAAGEFTLGSLQPGRYIIQIEASGFKIQKQMGLAVAAGQRVRVTYALEVGSVNTTVEISATVPLINTVNAEQRTNIASTQITELPTVRRDWTNLLNLNAGGRNGRLGEFRAAEHLHVPELQLRPGRQHRGRGRGERGQGNRVG
jgi:hypothetical protein